MSNNDLDRAMQALRAEEQRREDERLNRERVQQEETKAAGNRIRAAGRDFAARAKAAEIVPQSIELTVAHHIERHGLFLGKKRQVPEYEYKTGWVISPAGWSEGIHGGSVYDPGIYVLIDGTVLEDSTVMETASKKDAEMWINSMARYLMDPKWRHRGRKS